MNLKNKNSNELQPNGTKRVEPAKLEMRTIIIEYNEHLKVEISFPKSKQSQHDCTWLFSQAIKLLSDESESKNASLDLTNVVALKTKAGSVMLDYWLTLPDKPLTPIPDGTILVPYIGESRLRELINSDKEASAVTVQDFDILLQIGKGGYAKVYLARKKQSGRFYALKVIPKREGEGEDRSKKAVMRERKNFLKLKSEPNVIQLRHCFQTDKNYYFVMDFMPGGDLFYHICRRKFTEEEAKFYAMEILVILEQLHSSNYIFRDMKPENLLLDINGHVNFADLGFLKKVTNKNVVNYSYRGTPVYMAPEVIKKTGYSYLADYYSFGCVIFEIINGKPPFMAGTKKDLFDKVLNQDPVFPPHWSPELQDFLSGLLEKLPEDRLGAMNGFSELSRHPWLRELNVTNIRNKTFKPPINIDPNVMYFRPKPVDSDVLTDLGMCKLMAAQDASQLNALDSPVLKPHESLLKVRSKEFLFRKDDIFGTLQNTFPEDRQLRSQPSAGRFDRKSGVTYLQVPSQADTNVASKVRMTTSGRSKNNSPEESILTGSDRTPQNTSAANSPTSSINEAEDYQTMINEMRGFDRKPSEKMQNYGNFTKRIMTQANIRSPYYKHRERDRRTTRPTKIFCCCNLITSLKI